MPLFYVGVKQTITIFNDYAVAADTQEQAEVIARLYQRDVEFDWEDAEFEGEAEVIEARALHESDVPQETISIDDVDEADLPKGLFPGDEEEDEEVEQ